jgi:hypothetical protein
MSLRWTIRVAAALALCAVSSLATVAAIQPAHAAGPVVAVINAVAGNPPGKVPLNVAVVNTPGVGVLNGNNQPIPIYAPNAIPVSGSFSATSPSIEVFTLCAAGPVVPPNQSANDFRTRYANKHALVVAVIPTNNSGACTSTLNLFVEVFP